DLSVRVVERDADRLAAVLEREHLLDAGEVREFGGAIRPGFDHGAGATLGLRAERARVFGAEAHHLAAAHGRAFPTEAEFGEVVEPEGGIGVVAERGAERR